MELESYTRQRPRVSASRAMSSRHTNGCPGLAASAPVESQFPGAKSVYAVSSLRFLWPGLWILSTS